MNNSYVKVVHAGAIGVTGYIYTNEQGYMFVGIAPDADNTNINWIPVPDQAEGERVATGLLNEVQYAQQAAAAQAVQAAQQTYAQNPQAAQYAAHQQQYPQQYADPQQTQGFAPQGYPQQHVPQQYQMTPADYRKAEKKARNKAIRSEMWDMFKDVNARAALERNCTQYACPECSSGRGRKCVSIHGRNTLPTPHISRIEQYQRLRG